MTFIIKSQTDVQRLLRTNKFDDLITCAQGLDGEYGKLTATLMMKDLLEVSPCGKLIAILTKKGAVHAGLTLPPTRTKPGPKPGKTTTKRASKRKSSSSSPSQEEEPEAEEEEAEPEAEPEALPQSQHDDEAAFDSPIKKRRSA